MVPLKQSYYRLPPVLPYHLQPTNIQSRDDMKPAYTDIADPDIQSVRKDKYIDQSDASDSGVELEHDAADSSEDEDITTRSSAALPGSLAEVKPKSELIDRAILEYSRPKVVDKAKADKANALSTDPLTADQLSSLQASVASQPHMVGRVAAKIGGRRGKDMASASNGSTTRTLIRPGAATESGCGCHKRLEDLRQGELVYMCGKHLQWHNIEGDELTSFSVSGLFLVVFALQKRAAGCRKVTLQWVDTRSSQRPDGSPSPFYSAAVLYDVLDLKNNHPGANWLMEDDRTYTHERIGQGEITLKKDNFRPASIDELEEHGLLELLPTPDELMPPPYVFRECGFPASGLHAGSTMYDACQTYEKLTERLLNIAREVALCFVDESCGSTQEPPLHIFLQMLSFHKRWREEKVFMDWIKERYTSKHKYIRASKTSLY